MKQIFKRILSVLMVFVLVLACAPVIPLQANAETSGYYTYTVSNGEVTITDCDMEILGDIVIPDTLGGYPVTSIGERAFCDCYSLESVTIPNSVTSIGSYAFSNCDLTSVVIPDSVTSIGDWAFYHCGNLTSVIIGDSVTSIGNCAFFDCSGLTSVIIGDSVTSIGYSAFSYCYDLTSVVIPDSVTSIGNGAFSDCYSLTSVTIGNGVTSIGYGAFGSCYDLTSIEIPDSVTSIGDSAFEGCSSLTSVTIGNGVTSIGDSAFWDCSSLTSVTIPDSVTSIGDRAFEGCSELKDVYYAGSQARWNGITIGSDNYYLTYATIHYNHTHDYTLFPPMEVAATCTQKGGTQYTCAYGDTYMENVTPALGHDYSGVVTVVEPTCTEKGYTVTQCIRCTETKISNYTAALGHNCPSVEMVKEPTCTAEGSAVGQCAVCKETITSVISALGHKMVAVPAVDATCTTDGTTVGTKCERCDFIGIAPTVVPATGHSFADGACTACGLEGVALHKQDDVETYYDTLEEALAVTGGTIQLLTDVTADTVNLNANVTLDLNGYALTANSVSGKVMDSKDGEGLIKVGAQSAVLSSNDDQLILWDNATENPGYRVFNYTFTNMGMDAHKDDATESAKRGTTLKSFWSDLVFTNPYAYTLAASAYSTLSVGFEVSWTPEGGAATSKTFTFGTSVVADWGAEEESNAGDKNYCFYIGLTGFDDLQASGTVEVTPMMKTAFNSAEAGATELHHNYVQPNLGGLEYEVGFGEMPGAVAA